MENKKKIKVYNIYYNDIENNDIKLLTQFDNLEQVEKYLSIKKSTLKTMISRRQLIDNLYYIVVDTFNIKDIIVICDDTTLELGTLRFRKDGSHGGHNGLKSIINLTGSSDFDRLKVGIGPLIENMPVENFVLGNFRQDEIQTLDNCHLFL